MRNPFTPSEIASHPDDFFGRSAELETLERALTQGSVAIHGPIGIGKSSLLARGLTLMEGFDSDHSAKSVIAVGDKDIDTADKAARLILQSFVTVDEEHKRVTFKIGSVFERESAEICRNFVEGHHLASLKRIVEKEYMDLLLSDKELFIIAIDEADKCPVALARLIRSVVTHTQQKGAKRVRFLLAGVSPFFQQMVDEDPGVSRFVYKTISLEPLSEDDATDLTQAKLARTLESAEKEDKIELSVAPTIVERVVALSGGHPHILQLLGSHLIEHENEDPDGIIDSRDLVNSLRRICYEDRARVYDSTIHMLEVHGQLEALRIFLTLAEPGFPTRSRRKTALKNVGAESLKWLVSRDIISMPTADEYGLVDEFIRVRLELDEAESAEEVTATEQRV